MSDDLSTQMFEDEIAELRRQLAESEAKSQPGLYAGGDKYDDADREPNPLDDKGVRAHAAMLRARGQHAEAREFAKRAQEDRQRAAAADAAEFDSAL